MSSSIRPRRPAIDELGQHISEPGIGLTLLSLHVSMSDARHAQLRAPDRARRRDAFLDQAIGRIDRSTESESISMRPSSRNRIEPSHWFNPYWMASRTGDDLETRLR